MKIIILLVAGIFKFLPTLLINAQTEDGKTNKYRKSTINTQPLLMPLGFFVITYDRNIADHFILGTAIWYNNSKLSLLSNDKNGYLTAGGTLGLTYFPWNKESFGWHIAGYISPGYKRETGMDHREETPMVCTGSYLGYSLVCLYRIKLSFNAEAMFNYSLRITEKQYRKTDSPRFLCWKQDLCFELNHPFPAVSMYPHQLRRISSARSGPARIIFPMLRQVIELSKFVAYPA